MKAQWQVISDSYKVATAYEIAVNYLLTGSVLAKTGVTIAKPLSSTRACIGPWSLFFGNFRVGLLWPCCRSHVAVLWPCRSAPVPLLERFSRQPAAWRGFGCHLAEPLAPPAYLPRSRSSLMSPCRIRFGLGDDFIYCAINNRLTIFIIIKIPDTSPCVYFFKSK
jgi:hypothetical protein